MRILTLTLLCAAFPILAGAQSAELVYTPGVVKDALALKESLKITIVHPFDALSLVGASPKQKIAYKEKLSGVTALVILGDDALKSVADIEFTAPVVLVNASGPTAAVGRVIRIFDGSRTVPAGTVRIRSTADVRGLIVGTERGGPARRPADRHHRPGGDRRLEVSLQSQTRIVRECLETGSCFAGCRTARPDMQCRSARRG